jgi:hypothetical protein
MLNLEIPRSPDRLRIPIIETNIKRNVAISNQNLLEKFISEYAFHVPGEVIKYSDFYNKFHEWLEPSEQLKWSIKMMSKRMPPEFPVARIQSDGNSYIGNISWRPLSGKAKSEIVIKVHNKNNYLFHSNGDKIELHNADLKKHIG